jgi:glycosyltransferase involved in cell wall biosynthesis
VAPRVSIVIPTYNRSTVVRRAIDSVFAQTFQDFEVVVVDDGSTDDTRGALVGYPDRLRYIAQKNQGPAAARNHGMEQARGQFIGFLDSDDLYYPDNIEAHVRVFERNPAAGLVYSGSLIVDHEGNPIKEQRPDPRNRGDVLERLILYNFITTSTVLMRKECFTAVGGMNTRLWFAEDLYYWLRIAAKYPVDFAEQVLVRYQRSQIALSHGNPLMEIVPKHMEMLDLAFADPDLATRLRPLKAEAYRSAYASYAATALEILQPAVARDMACRAIAARPTGWKSYPLLAKTFLGSALLRRLRRWRRGG